MVVVAVGIGIWQAKTQTIVEVMVIGNMIIG